VPGVKPPEPNIERCQPISGSSNGFLGSISYRHLIGSDEVLQLNHLQMYLPTLSLIVDNNQGIEFPNQSWKYWPVVWIQNEVPSLCIFTLVLNFSNRFLLIIIHKGKREWSNVVIDWFSVLLFSHDRCGCTDSSCWCVFSSNNCNVICNSLVVPDTLDFVKSSSKIGNYWLIDEEALSPFFIT